MGGPIHDEQMQISVSGRTKQRSNIGHPPCAFGARGSSSEPGCSLCGHGLSEAQDLLRKGSLNSPVATYSGRAHNSRNLVFTVGGRMDQVFQALIDRTRTRMDLRTIKTILGYRRRRGKGPTWEVTVERPVYDLTIFKLHCGRLTLKIYTKGERVLRIEAMAHDTRELRCGRSLENFPEIVSRLKTILERF